MAQLKDLLVNGDAKINGMLLAENRSGGHILTPLYFQDASLPSKSLEYIVGIDGFAAGGQMGWQSKSNFLSSVQTQIDTIKSTYLPLAGGTLTGVVKQNKDGNPYYNLYDGTNNWYFQAIKADGACYIGPTSTKALKIDTNGNVVVKGTLTLLGDPTTALQAATKQYVDQACEDAAKLYVYTKTITADGTSSIKFNQNSSVNLNSCLVYYNGLLLTLGENYTISTDNQDIILNGWTANSGDIFTISGKQANENGLLSASSLSCGTIGSATLPVYFNNGIPAQCGTSLAVSITGNAATATTATSCTGNAATATKATQDGSGNVITSTYVPFISNHATGTDFNKIIDSGFHRVASGNTNSPGSDWGQLLVMHGGGDTITQIYGAYSTGELKTRSGNPSDVGGSGSWTAWKTLLDSSNYTSYTVTKTGSGASGTWGISISGNAATATSATTANKLTDIVAGDVASSSDTQRYVFFSYNDLKTNRPAYSTNFTYQTSTGTLTATKFKGALEGNATSATKATQDGNGATISSTYLKLSGGTMTGVISKAGSSSSWINGRDKALVRLNTYSAYSAITSMKTTNGSWDMGVYTDNYMYFTYTPDTNYSSGTNSGYTQIKISPRGQLIVPSDTDYTTGKCRNIYANTSTMTSGSTALTNGYIYLQYK